MKKIKYIFQFNTYLLTILLLSSTFFISASFVSATSTQPGQFTIEPQDIPGMNGQFILQQAVPYYTVEKESHFIREGDNTFTQDIISFYNQHGDRVEQHIIDTETYVYYLENGLETTTVQTAYQDNRVVFFEQKNIRDIEYESDGVKHSVLEKEYFDIWERPVKKVTIKTIDMGDRIHITENIYTMDNVPEEMKYTRIYPLEKGEIRNENHVYFSDNGSIKLRKTREFIRKPLDDSTWHQEERIDTFREGEEIVRSEHIIQTTSSINNVFIREREERSWDKENDKEYFSMVKETNKRFREDGELKIIRITESRDSFLEEIEISREEYSISEVQEKDRFLEKMEMKHYINDSLVEFTEKNTYRYTDFQIDKIVEYSYFDDEGRYHGGERILYYPDKTINLLFDPEHSIVERTITYTYSPQ